MKENYFLKTLILSLITILGVNDLKAEVDYSIPLSGKEHQIGSLLNWTTGNEENSQVFVVERSIDGIDYQVIGEVEAAGFSNYESGYRFLDVGVNDPKSYYRLRQVDTDGTTSFSQTILIKKEIDNNFMVLAMTNTFAKNSFTVTLDAVINGEIYIALRNKTGETVYSSKQELNFGINEVVINLENEKVGTYFVVLKVKDEKEELVVRKVEDEIKAKENVASKKQSNGG